MCHPRAKARGDGETNATIPTSLGLCRDRGKTQEALLRMGGVPTSIQGLPPPPHHPPPQTIPSQDHHTHPPQAPMQYTSCFESYKPFLSLLNIACK